MQNRHLGLISKLVEVHLLAHTFTLGEAETYGDCLSYPLNYIDVWKATKSGAGQLTPLVTPIRAMIAASEYDVWPRGRLVWERTA